MTAREAFEWGTLVFLLIGLIGNILGFVHDVIAFALIAPAIVTMARGMWRFK